MFVIARCSYVHETPVGDAVDFALRGTYILYPHVLGVDGVVLMILTYFVRRLSSTYFLVPSARCIFFFSFLPFFSHPIHTRHISSGLSLFPLWMLLMSNYYCLCLL